MIFAAVELKPGETAHGTVKCVVQAAATSGCNFKVLELLGILTLGRIKFIRFRVDGKVLVEALKTLDRGVIHQSKDGYMLTFPGEIPGKVSITDMQMAGEPGIKRTYRGPGVQYWERQFL